ncbi:MAG: hypothetical protein AABW82_04385 [Nanoarchaeota archaeon]
MSNREITREEVEPLLRDSPLRERIDYLLENPELGSRPLTRLNGYGNIYPNCFGTTLFLLDAQRDLLDKFRRRLGLRGELIVQSKTGEDFMVFPKKLIGPGSLQPNYVEFFLDKHCTKTSSPIHGRIVVTSGISDQENYHSTLHSAVYLGEIDKVPYVFEQNGLGKEFRFDLFYRMVNKNGITGNSFYRYNPRE